MGVNVDYAHGIDAHKEEIDTIYITANGYIRRPFRGISRDSMLGYEEAVFSSELSRSIDLVLTNIDKVDFGLVARCDISYKYMNTQDFIALRNIAKQRTCIVDFFNRDTGRRETREMAFTESSLSNLYKYGKDWLGVQGVTISLVATNREKTDLIKSKCTITYIDADSGQEILSTQSATWSEVCILNDGKTLIKQGYALVGYNTDPNGNGWAYLPNQHITMFDNLKLYPQWKRAE